MERAYPFNRNGKQSALHYLAKVIEKPFFPPLAYCELYMQSDDEDEEAECVYRHVEDWYAKELRDKGAYEKVFRDEVRAYA